MGISRLASALVLGLAACSGGGTPADMGASPDLSCPRPAGGAKHAIHLTVQLTEEQGRVPFKTQNDSTAYIPTADIVGKPLFWATVAGGASVVNDPLIEVGTAAVGGDLKVSLTTAESYADGFWEVGLFISLTGNDPMKGPQTGDLAGFDIAPPPACEPPVTGVSVRVRIDGGDASVTLENRHFIRF